MKLLPLVSLVIASLGVASAAQADAPVAGPAAGSWSTQLRYEDTTTFSDTGVVLGMSGFQLGIGNRISDRWYLGGTAELQLGENVSDVDNGFAESLRAGAEARYIFHQGTAAVSSNGDDGPFTPVPRYDWIGVRGGAQSVNGAHGGFGEVELGGDAQITKSTQLGLFLAVGVNVEPPDTFGTLQVWNSTTDSAQPAPSANPSSLVTSPYVSFGVDLAFG